MNGSKLHSYSRHRRRVYFIVLAIAVFIASSFPFDLQAARGEPRVIEIRAKRFEYIPNVIEIKKGEKVLLKLTSEDVTHGFFLDGYELEFFVNPGETRQVMLKADKEGKFMFRCSTTCGVFHPYMVGYLKVTPNTPFTFAMLGIILLGLGSLVITLVRKKENPDKLFGIIPIKWRFELTRFKIVRKLLKSRLFPFALILFNLFVFVIILFAAFFGGNSTGNYNFGIMIVWILWWFLLMGFMVPVIGRFWCMMCPFPMVGEWFQRGKLFKMGRLKSRGLAKKWPKNWRNLWPVTILFFISTWASGFFTVRPMSTFILLGVIILGAIVLSSIFEKRTFCLYVCPVSGFQGLYANSSVCEVRVKDTEVCKNHKVKTCVVGNEKGYGCPWGEIPFDMNRNTYCGLCMECFKSCPHDNMALNVRPPGADFINERRKTDDMYKRRSWDEAFKAISMLG
ncbi:MAG: 4Fe-4S binding protein, partial [bacterium]|nr:4Fe-4S binding protein [bacterium]